MIANWNSADVNGDGKLDLAESRAFAAAIKAQKDEEGDWSESLDLVEENYNIINMISEGDGYTMAEMWMAMGPWMAKFMECKAAAGL